MRDTIFQKITIKTNLLFPIGTIKETGGGAASVWRTISEWMTFERRDPAAEHRFRFWPRSGLGDNNDPQQRKWRIFYHVFKSKYEHFERIG
jgi:hypothetical protein